MSRKNENFKDSAVFNLLANHRWSKKRGCWSGISCRRGRHDCTDRETGWQYRGERAGAVGLQGGLLFVARRLLL